MKIEIELNEKQADALNEIIGILGNGLTREEFCKKSVLAVVIQNKQKLVSEELSR